MGRGKEQLGWLPFLTTWLKERHFLLTKNQRSPRGCHHIASGACNSLGPLCCQRCHLRCFARLPVSSSCPSGFAQESWGRQHGCWCHRRLCSHCSSLCCPRFLPPTPPSCSPPAPPPGLHAARCWVCVGEGSGGRLCEAEFGHGPPPAAAGSALFLAVPPGPKSEKAPVDDVWFPWVNIHGSFLFSMPLLSPRDLCSQWWLAYPRPATSFMGQTLWVRCLSVITGARVQPIASPHYRSPLSFRVRPHKDQVTSSARMLRGHSALSKHGCSGDRHHVPVWCSVAFQVSHLV